MKLIKKIIKGLVYSFIHRNSHGFISGKNNSIEEVQVKTSWENVDYNDYKNEFINTEKNNDLSFNNKRINTKGMFSWDYPVIHWINKIKSEIDSVCDYGGSIGQSFYKYKKYIDLKNISWHVYDLPKAEKTFEKIWGNNRQINFKNILTENNIECDVFFASSSLQYDSRTISDVIKSKKNSFEYILINRTPFVTHSKGFFAKQKTRSGISYPIRISCYEDLTGLFEEYIMLDEWYDDRDSGYIPFYDIEIIFKGFLLRKK